MSEIARRLGRMLKSNLNALLDVVGDHEDHAALSALSDDELLAELERRRAERARATQGGQAAGGQAGVRGAGAAATARGRGLDPDAEARAWVEREQAKRRAAAEAAAAAARARAYRTAPAGSSSRSSSRPGASAGGPPRGRRENRLAAAYAALECPYGADLATVKAQYRHLLRKYHPDLHQGSPEKQKLATELTRKLTEAYDELARALGGKG